MAKYNSYEEFQKSGDPLLNAVTKLSFIEKGTMYFNLELDGKKYAMSGSHCFISDYYWSDDDTVSDLCDFDNFWLYEVVNESNEICNW